MLKKATAQSSSSEQRTSKGHRKANFWLIRREYQPSKIYKGNFLVKASDSLKRMNRSCVMGFFRVKR